ncbi:MAG: SMP-30/gluconolactonase/LRE family protein, partial [Verrucomicrobiaceae bacterium]|nr:SMP-30/gluconolactonase/LRE family protein [Verrucomicrobiaceae bacterium]
MKRLVLSLALATSALAADPVPAFEGSIERLDPALDALLAADAKIEVLATGFNWSEGPVWKDGGILFSDVPENTVFGWKDGDKTASTVLKPSGSLSGAGGQGSNGLALDAKGRLILCQHGERRIARLEKDGTFTSIADRWEGKRFNSPNDLVISSKGTIFFTDPPYGLKKDTDTPELDFHGIYAVQADVPGSPAILLIKDIQWPNGIALSPDEKTLYVAVSDKDNTRIMAYDLPGKGKAGIAGVIQGTIIPKPGNGRELFHAQKLKSATRKGGCDGLKVDSQG